MGIAFFEVVVELGLKSSIVLLMVEFFDMANEKLMEEMDLEGNIYFNLESVWDL